MPIEEADEITESYASQEARKAFIRMEQVRNNLDGVSQLEAESVAKSWNSWVHWIMPEDVDVSEYEVRVKEVLGAWGISVGPGVDKMEGNRRKRLK